MYYICIVKKSLWAYSIIFIAILFSGMIWQNIVVVDYIVNQEEIIAEKCENKANPESHCHGACYVNKQLIKMEGSSPIESNVSINVLDLWLLSYQDMRILKTTITPFSKEIAYYKSCFSLRKGINSEIFHPPQIA